MSRDLARYIAIRFGQLVLIVVIAVSINFLVPRLLPGDPIETLIARLQSAGGSQEIDAQAITTAFRAKYGLDQPLVVQYVQYWSNLLRGDLGVSLSSYPQPVSTLIVQALPWSVGLLTVATLIAFTIGSILGARLAWPRSSRLIRTFVPALMVLATVPFYLLAMILIYLFAVVWRIFPPAGGASPTHIMRLDMATVMDIAHHAILPALAIVLGSVGLWALGMRSQMVSVLGEDYITFAEAKGLRPNRIFLRYGMRNAMLPQVTALALSLGHVVSGAVLVEVIFNYPGLGQLLYNAVRGQDYFLVQGVVLMLILTLALLLFIVDLIYPLLDPRIRR
jgi:peptide/nickel transport system permease protein